MPAGAPYLYSPTSNNGAEFEYNPRAYTQATYAAALERQMPKPERKGPLVDLNRHPDSWEVLATSKSSVEPLPASFRTKILACRWLQLGHRVLQLVIALGLFVCMLCTRGIPAAQGWIMRIPPAYDAFLNIYAIYHLARAADKRPAGSSASYCLFALIMDIGLIPFYVYTSMLAYSNFKQTPGTEGRWTTVFPSSGTTTLMLQASFLAAATLGGLHVLSIILDLLLLFWFRKISNMPPDMNPLVTHNPRISKHKYKNSEMSASTMSLDEKKLSTISVESSASLPQGYTVPSPNLRQVPFVRSRMDSDMSFSPHTLATAQAVRANVNGSFYQQPGSARASQYSVQHSRPGSFVDANGAHSPYADHNTSVRPGSGPRPATRPSPRVPFYERAKTASPAPQVAQDPRTAKAAQEQSLLRENWYVINDGSDIGTPERSNTPRPTDRVLSVTNPTAPKNDTNYIKSADVTDKENNGDIHRQLTVSSSVYSDDAHSVSSAGTAKQGKSYGGLTGPVSQATSESRWFGKPLQSGGGRVVSRTGIELSDGADPFDPTSMARQRNVSGKIAEEGASKWMRRP